MCCLHFGLILPQKHSKGESVWIALVRGGGYVDCQQIWGNLSFTFEDIGTENSSWETHLVGIEDKRNRNNGSVTILIWRRQFVWTGFVGGLVDWPTTSVQQPKDLWIFQ